MLPRSLSLLIATFALATSLLGQSEILPVSGEPPPHKAGGALTQVCRTVLTAANVVPPVGGLTASVAVTFRIHRADSQPAYALDFLADYHFPGPVTINGFQIYRGAAGTNGTLALDSGVSVAQPRTSQTGAGSIAIQLSGITTPGLAAVLTDIQSNPSTYYVSMQTTDNQSGAVRGQLGAAQQSVVMGVMIPANEVPAGGGSQSGVGTAVATITRDASGAISSGDVLFDVNYQFPNSDTLTGLAIHSGAAGVSGPVVLDSGLTSTPVNGSGNVRLRNEMDITKPAVAAALEALFSDPSNYYMEITTASDPAGAMRSQLGRASHSSLQVGLGESNLQANPATLPIADGQISFDVLRSGTGDLQAGMLTFDLDYNNFSQDTQFTSLSAGDLTASLSSPATTASGQGNLYRLVTVGDSAGLAALENTLDTLAGGVELETAAQTDSIVGPFLFEEAHIAGVLAIASIESASGDPAITTAAPGSLISLYGSFPVNPIDVTGLNQPWPTSLNGAYVTVGGSPIPVGYLSTGQINVQIPAGTAVGQQTVQFWVKATTNGAPDYRSNTVQIFVAAQAPAIFVSAAGPAVVHSSGVPVSAAQPAASGELVMVYVTGVAAQNGSFPPVAATVGGAAATVESVAALPAFPGVELVALQIPAGLGSLSVPLQLNVAGVPSNAVNIPVE